MNCKYILFLILLCEQLVAQPTITSFSPTSGPIGTSVIITGTSFSTTPANNIVFFGATQATVTTATATELIVTVPTGATDQPITVLNNGLMAYSNAPFVVTFLGGGLIDASSFHAKIDQTTETLPRSVSIGDLDGDNKADIAVANESSNTVSILRNSTSSPSTAADITSFSLAEQTGAATIGAGTIDIEVVNGKDITTLVPTFTLSTGASATVNTIAQTSGTTANDFANPVIYTVTAEDGVTTKDWVVTVTEKPLQVPSISSFSPTSGSIGTSVTITGTNFDTTPANNIVFFGATQASVAAATTTELTVTVPAGATYQPITVLTNGLLAYSSKAFVVIFAGDGSIDINSFDPKVDFTTGSNPWSVSIGDLDGDGKADLAVVNYHNASVSVFRNTSTGPGVISYATKVDYTTGLYPISVSIGDLDGDGKADLTVANNGDNTVSVFRNTSTGPGVISYATKVDFTTGAQPKSVSIRDLDGDGKADLAVANVNSNTVSVLRNTSTGPGVISYAPKVDFTTGATPWSVSIGDLDGDGKADLAVTNNGSNTVSVFRNTSAAPGVISYASKVDFTTEDQPYSVPIGDLDGDGKADLAVINYNSNTVSVFRNTSTAPGVISYATKVSYTTGINPFSIAIGDLDGDGKADLAVVSPTSSTVSVFKNTSTGSGVIGYATKVDYATGEQPYSVAIGDLDGDGKADLTAVNFNSNTVSVFRNAMASSTSIATDITSFSFPEQTSVAIIKVGTIDIEVANGTDITNLAPTFTLSTSATATIGATTQLSGTTTNDFTNPVVYTVTAQDGVTTQNWTVNVTVAAGVSTATNITAFSLPQQTSAATIGSETIGIEVANGTDVTALVPTYSLSTGASATVNTILQTSGTTANDFTNPVTYTVTAEDGTTTQDWTITVTAATLNATDITSFSFVEQTDAAIIGAGTIDLVVAYGSDLTTLVPTFTLSTGATATIGVNAQTSGTTPNDFTNPVFYTVTAQDGITTQNWTVTVTVATLNLPTITSFTPRSGPVGTTVTITGTNFNTTPTNNIVFFGATQATVTAATATELTVTVPTGTTYQPITVLSNSLIAYSNIPFTVTFSGRGPIDANSFDPKIDYTSGTGLRSVSIGDLDGDGKSDLALVNIISNTVSILRNTSIGDGSISYDTKVDNSTGLSPISIAIGDLDGDGKADLAVANQASSTISVFRNTSTVVGTISFATKVDYPTGVDPISVAIGDLDEDGKADLAVANVSSSTLSVLRNTSTGTGVISFDSKIDFTTGANPYSVAIGDLDGDGKSDLAIANTTSSTLSILMNTSTGFGSISYDTKVDYPTGLNPQSVAIGDLDGDDKADLAVANFTDNTVSVLMNTSTGAGSISYDTKIDYTTGTNPFSIAIGDLDGDGKVDLAVANQTSSTLSVLRNMSTVGSINYAAKVDYISGTDPVSVSIGDLDGKGKTDMVVANSGSNSVSIFRNAILSIETDITNFSFAEQTGAATIGAGTIDIEVAIGTDLTTLVPTFSLSTGAIATVNTIAQISGTTVNNYTNPVVYTVTAEDGITTQEWTVTVIVQEDLANPEISSMSLPTIIEAGSSGAEASITVTDNVALSAITFYYKLSNASNFSSQVLTASGDTYTINITESMVTDVGLEYYFLAEDTNVNNASTDTVQIVIQYNSTNGSTIPNLSAGGNPENWRMFSIPFVLDNKNISTLFETHLGTYDDTKWRLVHYKNDTDNFVEYKNGLSIIERGKGYWFNSVLPATIPMSPGIGHRNTTNNLASITLQQGWNQIGNPYTFDVSWNDVINHNGISNEVESNLRVFENSTSLTNSTTLKAFKGAYIKANESITLEIPIITNTGGRLAKINSFDQGWLLNLKLEAGLYTNTVSGLGMHPEAIASNDKYDQVRAPRFANYIDATFDHPEYFMPNFSRDVVTEQENFIWEFTISSNITDKTKKISWDKSTFSGNQKLILIDQANGSVVDMLSNNGYSYTTDQHRDFKVVYGDDNFLKLQFINNAIFLGDSYPNPFNDRTNIPFSIYGKKNAYQIKLNIFNINGKRVSTLMDSTLPQGVYNVEWDGTDELGYKLEGMYIYSLEISTNHGVKSFRKKIIVQ